MGNRKLPFGYKMVMGEIVVHPQEAQAVQGIYARYLAGASFNDITDHLKEKGPPYDADKPWNKNPVCGREVPVNLKDVLSDSDADLVGTAVLCDECAEGWMELHGKQSET